MAPVTRHQASGDGLVGNKSRHKRASSWDLLESQVHNAKNIGSARALHPSIEADHDDAITPLRNMADRVGKEVEKFAERLDLWLGYGTERTPGSEGKSPGTMVTRFRDEAKAISKPLKQRSIKEDTGARVSTTQRLISLREGLFEDVSVLEDTAGGGQGDHLNNVQKWEGEVDTWDLALLILSHRLSDATAGKEAPQQPKELHRYSSRQDVWDQFMLHDEDAKEKSLVLKWLQETADKNGERIEKLGEQFEKLGDGGHHGHGSWTHGWMATKERIKGEKRMGTLSHTNTEGPQPDLLNSSKSGLLVTQLDPDAPSRQSRILEDSDEYQERFLWFVSYQLLRRGKSLDEIRSWMNERNEGWRSVSLGITQEDDQPSSSVVAHGILWRRMCHAAANASNNIYERAVYGLLGGDLTSVRPVCSTWEDHLYAHFNCILSFRFDHFIKVAYPQTPGLTAARKFPSFNSRAFYGNAIPINDTVIQIINSEPSLKPSNLQRIQASLLTDSLDQLMCDVGAAIAEIACLDPRGKELYFTPEVPVKGYESFAEDEQALRVLLHAYLAFDEYYASKAPKRPAAQIKTMENLIVWYMELLRSARKLDLLPLYAAQLSPNRLGRTMALILPDIKSEEDQKRMVRLMTRYRVNVEFILEKQYQMALASCGLRSKVSLKDEPVAGNVDIVNPPTTPEFKILQKTTDYKWPGQKICVGFIKEDIQPPERAVIDAVHWFLHLKTWKLIFSSLEDALARFLAYGRVSAAFALSTQLPCAEISLEKTPHFLKGEVIDITLWEENGTAEPLSESEHEHSLRRPSLSRRRSPRVALDQSEPLEITITKKILKQDSKAAYDLQQLVLAIGALHEWATIEEEFITNGAQNSSTDKSSLKEVFDTISEILHPFLKKSTNTLYGIATAATPTSAAGPATVSIASSIATTELGAHFSVDVRRITNLRALLPFILPVYVPELVLAYASTIQSASHLLTRQYLTMSMELAALLADDECEEVVDLFAEVGRMRELVRLFASTGRCMVGMGSREKGDKPRRREWEGETIRVWDMTVRN
ncbi:hypothetical protein EJ05DRAFT_479349 [Pseudovirgaria hyperparasitica]|uniref:Nuclear pore complex protein n=1 Tax=Pseudovirgaria hyperparasitica TaxID=470096 RepID=A0A6A6VUW0_9PEZI|nr:uncharacterized protein EJ05DRAFT_479349 [Pseudovirgaria hyperparasitica]KAF2754352.1 hypothetical protein EJ05DRAFT_479349 [Pseudovirgaria hyperparasitica]